MHWEWTHRRRPLGVGWLLVAGVPPTRSSTVAGSGSTTAGSRLVAESGRTAHQEWYGCCERIHRHWEYASCWERVSRQGFEYSSQAPQLSRAVIILSRVRACSMTSLIRPSQ